MIPNYIESSETTREPPFFNFDFANYIKHHRPELQCQEEISITTHFLEWFIGFAESNGCFESRLTKDGPRISFTIVQKDLQLLYKVKKGLGPFRDLQEIFSCLGFGSFSKDRNYLHFRVDDKRGIQRLQSIFNGNLVLPKRRTQFSN